jgi:hypothetical protein
MRAPTERERRMIQMHGQPADRVAVALRMTIAEVLEMRAQLRDRGLTPRSPALADATVRQLAFEDLEHRDQLLHANPPLPPTEAELEVTTSTDQLGGW